jgi:hypothetical protein
MQGGVEALMGHGVEDVGGRVVWEHGEVIGMDADRVRVEYHSDKLKLWHRRFRMDYYGNLAKPVETTEVGGAGVAKRAYCSWRLHYRALPTSQGRIGSVTNFITFVSKLT